MLKVVLLLSLPGPCPCLLQRIIRTAENRPCVSQRVNLTGSRFPAHVEVLEQPITVRMERRDVLERRRELIPKRLPLSLVRLELTFQGGLRRYLVCQSLRVFGALLSGVAHQDHIISLSVLLCCLGLSHVLVKVIYENIYHLDHTGILLRFCLVRADCLWWRWWGNLCS